MNKKAILIANIGNSDIGKDGKPEFSGHELDVYEESKKSYESGNFYDMDLLLLDPVIYKIKKDYQIEKVYLFSTEQEPRHRQDTKYIGEMVKKIICKRLNLDEDHVKNIILTRNPSDYDAMFKYYEEEITNLNVNPDIVYVSITGGTQQQNMALLLSTVSRFEELTQAVYVPRGTTEVKEYTIGSMVYKKFLTQRVEELEKRYLYGPAADIAEKYGVLDVNEIKFLRAKAKRDLFDFDGSLKILNEIKNKIPAKRQKIMNAIEELENLTKEDEKERINELYRNMEVRWEQGAYVDFLGRLFRFEEAVYYFILSRKFGIDISVKNNYKKFIEKIKQNVELSKFIESKKYRGQRIKIDINSVNRPFLFFILSFYKKEFGLIVDVFNKINDYEGNPDGSLGNLRNKSILAHGFRGVSKEDIEGRYKGNLIKDIEKIVKFIKNCKI